MVTGKSQPGADPLQPLPPSAAHTDPIPTSPPSKRDLTSWWRQFKRGTRKDESKGMLGGVLISWSVDVACSCDLASDRHCAKSTKSSVAAHPSSLTIIVLGMTLTDPWQINPKASLAFPSTSASNMPMSPSPSPTTMGRVSSTATCP